jgi:hypothetical protein
MLIFKLREVRDPCLVTQCCWLEVKWIFWSVARNMNIHWANKNMQLAAIGRNMSSHTNEPRSFTDTTVYSPPLYFLQCSIHGCSSASGRKQDFFRFHTTVVYRPSVDVRRKHPTWDRGFESHLSIDVCVCSVCVLSELKLLIKKA